MQFASDNAAGIAPAILEAIGQVNDGHAHGYGDDPVSRRLETRFCELFERDVAVFLVTTGTAANALALAHLSPPWGAVLCHAESHINVHECGAPEFYGGGLRLVGLDGPGGKVEPHALAAALGQRFGLAPHQAVPAVLSLTQPTEFGTLYSLDEIAVLADVAHRHGMAVHMDGARFANAVARHGVTPADASWKVGVDVLSFGATKGGALGAEAVVFFDPARAAAMAERRKRGGHLASKHRFIAAQFEAFLADDLWLALAGHANRMANLLAGRLTGIGFAPVWTVEANLVFVMLPRTTHERLQAAGAHYYVIRGHEADPQAIPPGHLLVRLVTSYATTARDVEKFIDLAKPT